MHIYIYTHMHACMAIHGVVSLSTHMRKEHTKENKEYEVRRLFCPITLI